MDDRGTNRRHEPTEPASSTRRTTPTTTEKIRDGTRLDNASAAFLRRQQTTRKETTCSPHGLLSHAGLLQQHGHKQTDLAGVPAMAALGPQTPQLRGCASGPTTALPLPERGARLPATPATRPASAECGRDHPEDMARTASPQVAATCAHISCNGLSTYCPKSPREYPPQETRVSPARWQSSIKVRPMPSKFGLTFTRLGTNCGNGGATARAQGAFGSQEIGQDACRIRAH